MSRDHVLLLLNFLASFLVGTGVMAAVQYFSADGTVDWLPSLLVGLALGLGNSWRLYGRWRRHDSQASDSKH